MKSDCVVICTIRGNKYYIRETDKGEFFYEGLIDNATKYSRQDAEVVTSLIETNGELTIQCGVNQ